MENAYRILYLVVLTALGVGILFSLIRAMPPLDNSSSMTVLEKGLSYRFWPALPKMSVRGLRA